MASRSNLPSTPDAPATPNRTEDKISVRRLGLVEYATALELQKSLVDERRAGAIGNTLLLLEHPPVITVGVRNRAGRANIVASAEALAREGIPVVETGRGGDVTYHGPGQLIGYPIFDLRPNRCDVHRYVRDLEQALIIAVRSFGVSAHRVSGLSGVWVGDDKLAAIGVRISRWITSHGFALNVTTDLGGFEAIIPCGIPDRGVTSLERLLGRPVAMADAESAVIEGVRSVFAPPAIHQGPGSSVAF
jgi:lipoyl(octanoyl) transferase